METTLSASKKTRQTAAQSVEQFLSKYSNRRLMLQVVRAVFLSMFAFLLGIILIVAIDCLLGLESTWRWTLTCSVYSGAIVLAWKLGGSRLVFRPPIEDVAWSVEQTHPALRESLLAMVQLRREDGTTRSGSQNFLDAIGRKVARELSHLNLQTMLPWKAIHESVYLLTGLLWLVLIACFVPNIRFAERFAKALIPFVSFESTDGIASALANRELNPRVVGFHFEIISPDYAAITNVFKKSQRGDLRILKGSTLRLELDVDHPVSLASIAMEFSDTGRKQIVSLQQAKPVLDIKKSTNNPLHSGAVQRFSSEFLVEESSVYEVRLVSERMVNGKRLENTYSPRYRMDAIEDLGAELKWRTTDKTPWQEPPQNNQVFLIANDATIDLSLSVADNLPVDKLVHEVSVNRGIWTTINPTLAATAIPSAEDSAEPAVDATQPISKSTIDWKWDLSLQDVQSGDSIVTRVTATDRKGNISHSASLVFSLAAKNFDRRRHQSLLKRCELVTLLDSLSEATNKDRGTLRSKLERLKTGDLSDPERKNTIDELNKIILTSTRTSQDVRSTAIGLMKEIGRCVDQAEIELAVRLVARMEKEWLTDLNDGINASLRSVSDESDSKRAEWIKKETQLRGDRMLHAYDASCDGAKQLASVFRQIIGLEMQSVMTRDLTDLRDFQQKELLRFPLADLTELSRISEVTMQYLDSTTKLAMQVEPHVPGELRGRLAELYQWMEQTRADLNDLIAQETVDQTPRIRNRLEKCVADLRRVRWVYHLQGNLAWDVSNGRNDLLIRGGTVWQPFSRLLSRQTLSAETSKNRTLATDLLVDMKTAYLQEVNGPIASAFTQLSDRREIHQSRQSSDPEFVSDIGLTQRAWMHLLQRLNSESLDANQNMMDAKAIANAFRILESFHETVEARKTVQSLLPIEQFDWQSMEAQLWSTKQWESIPSRLEMAHQWMKEAGFAHAIADRYNSLRWSEPWNQIQGKIQPRRDVNHMNLVSAADELRALLLLWSDLDLAAKPMVDEARAILAKLSPSVSQLAKEAAELTSQLQKTTEEMAAPKQRESNESKIQPVPTAEQFQHERDASERAIMELQDALIELANKQNLLDQAEREMAKDGDSALKLLDTVLAEMSKALDDLQLQKNTMLHPSSDSVAKASDTASKSIEAIEKIARHFSKIESKSPVADIPAEKDAFRGESDSLDKESIEANPNEIDQEPQLEDTDAYKRAEQLSELDNSDTETLLQKLESELKLNPSMQSELSEISKANIRSQAAELQIASEVESALAKELENADGRLAGEKRLRLEQLRAAVEQADRIGLRLLGNSQQAAQRTGAKAQASILEKTAGELRREIQNTRALGEDSSRQEIETAVRSFAEQIDESLSQVALANKGMKPIVEQLAHKEERIRQSIRLEAQNVQNQNRNEWIHQAKEHVIQSQRQLDASKRRLEKSQADFAQASKDRKAIQEKTEANPNDKSLENQLLQATNKAEQAFVKQSWEEQIASLAELSANNARVRVSELEKLERANLDRPNPHAALAIEQLENAEDQLAQIREQATKTLDSVKQFPLPRTPFKKIEEEAISQQRVEDSVLDASRQLARSSRHEARLGNATEAAELALQSQRVAELAKGTVEAAKSELESAGKSSQAIEQQQSSTRKAEEIQESFQRADTSLAQKGLNAASQELSGESKRTLGQVGPLAAPQESISSTTTRPKELDPASRKTNLLEARDMARMLDLLDQQAHQGSDRSNQDPGDPQTSASKQGDGKTQSKSQSKQSSKRGNEDQDRNGARSAFKDSIKSAAEKLANSMGQSRQAQRGASQTRTKQRNSSSGNPLKRNQGERDLSDVDIGTDSVLPGMTQSNNRDWGKLREQRAKDTVEGRRDEFDPEFEEAIQAYYRALGNREQTKSK